MTREELEKELEIRAEELDFIKSALRKCSVENDCLTRLIEQERNIVKSQMLGSGSMDDELKISYFRQHFDKISMEDLENIVENKSKK